MTVMDSAATASLHASVPFAAHLGIEIVAATAKSVTGRLAWQEQLCTAGGALNGGVIMALADNVGALCAFMNLPKGSAGTDHDRIKNQLPPRGPRRSRGGGSPSAPRRSANYRSRIRRSR